MQAELNESQPKHDQRTFGAVTSPLVIGMQDERDLALTMLRAREEQTELAD
jgi:hypothetical protein